MTATQPLNGPVYKTRSIINHLQITPKGYTHLKGEWKSTIQANPKSGATCYMFYVMTMD